MTTYRITKTAYASQPSPARDSRGRVTSQPSPAVDMHYLTEAEDLQAAQQIAVTLCGPHDAIRRIVRQETPEVGQIWTDGQRLYLLDAIESRPGATQLDYHWRQTSTGREFWTLGGQFFERVSFVCND